MKPSPKATPISPKALARLSGVEMSASTAAAVAAVPPLRPSISRAMNNRASGRPAERAAGQVLAQGNAMVALNRLRPSTEPATQLAMTGLRP